jgi:DNA-binding transcriptional regulator GbsR (MarR family)
MERGPSQAQLDFVERMGLHFERMGVSRIGGRMLGLLIVSERPLALDDLARQLGVSRASVSTNLQVFGQLGFVEQVPVAGERRRCFGASANAWQLRLEGVARDGVSLRRAVEVGLAAVPDGSAAHARLRRAEAFAVFLEEEALGMAERWRARLAALEGG